MYMNGYSRGTTVAVLASENSCLARGFEIFSISANPRVFVPILSIIRCFPAFRLCLRWFPVNFSILASFSALWAPSLWCVWYELYLRQRAHVQCAMLLLPGIVSDLSGSFGPVQHFLRACLPYWLVAHCAMLLVHCFHSRACWCAFQHGYFPLICVLECWRLSVSDVCKLAGNTSLLLLNAKNLCSILRMRFFILRLSLQWPAICPALPCPVGVVR